MIPDHVSDFEDRYCLPNLTSVSIKQDYFCRCKRYDAMMVALIVANMVDKRAFDVYMDHLVTGKGYRTDLYPWWRTETTLCNRSWFIPLDISV